MCVCAIMSLRLLRPSTHTPRNPFITTTTFTNTPSSTHLPTSECAATSSYAFDGDFTYALFDLKNDPYETNNLYLDSKYDTVKTELYALLDKYNQKSGEDVVKSIKASKKASVFWQAAGGYIVPYTNEDNVAYGLGSYGQSWPKLCKR